MRHKIRPTPKQRSAYVAVGLFKFFAGLFEANEMRFAGYFIKYNAFKQKPLTDEEIARIVAHHFPAQRKLLSRPPQKYYGFWPSVNYYRGRYNRGIVRSRVDPDLIPDRVSFRYNSDGKRVSGRSGIRLLTQKEVSRILMGHEAKLLSARLPGRPER